MSDDVVGVIGVPTKPADPVNIRFRPRNGLVVVRRIRPDEGGVVREGVQKTASGIYLSEGNHDGDFFWEMIVVEVGRGIMLDAPGTLPSGISQVLYGGTNDLNPGDRVYVKAGMRMRDPRSGGVQSSEQRSILQLKVPGDDLYLCNQHDIFGQIIVGANEIVPE